MISSKSQFNATLRNVHLVSQCLIPHDAVSRHIFDVGAFLSKQGHRVSYYAKVIDPEYQSLVKPISQLDNPPLNDLIFYQYSIWEPNLEFILSLPHQKIVYYHGITTPELLMESMPLCAVDCKKGLDSLPSLRNFDWILANSEFDLSQITAHFTPKQFAVLPPYVQNPELKAKSTSAQLDPYHLVCVGRFFPHKNLEKVISVFSDLKKIDSNYRLTLAGSGMYEPYLEKIKDLASKHSNIKFKFDIDQSELGRLYSSAAALINFSLHEGFGMPLIEAFQNRIPVISHSYTAIPETLKGAGILLEDHYTKNDVMKVHELIHHHREDILSNQDRQFENHYSNLVVRKKYEIFFRRVLEQ